MKINPGFKVLLDAHLVSDGRSQRERMEEVEARSQGRFPDQFAVLDAARGVVLSRAKSNRHEQEGGLDIFFDALSEEELALLRSVLAEQYSANDNPWIALGRVWRVTLFDGDRIAVNLIESSSQDVAEKRLSFLV